MKKIKFLIIVVAFALCVSGCEKEVQVVEIPFSGSDNMEKTEGQRPEGGMPSGMEMPQGGMPPSGEKNVQRPNGSNPDGKGKVGERFPPNGNPINGQEHSAEQLTLSAGEVIGKVESITGNRVTMQMGSISKGKTTYGDEVKAYLLPVGMKIGSGDFSSITTGMVLKLKIDTQADGSENITAVTIVSR